MENNNTVFNSSNPENQNQQQNQGQSFVPNSPLAEYMQSQPQFSQVFSNNRPAAPSGPPNNSSDPLFNPQKSAKLSGFKKFISIFLSTLMILGFIAVLVLVLMFGINKNSTDKVNITYWGLEDERVMKEMISEFIKQNPSITVEYSKQDISRYREMLMTRILNGNGPDIFRFHNTWYPMLKDVLLPLPSETIKPDEFKNAYYPVIQKDLVKKGAIYGIPLQIDTLALFINNQVFQSAGLTAPTTWDAFDSAAKAVTVKDGNKIVTAGAGIGTFDNVNHAADIMSLLFLENNVNFNNLTASQAQIKDAIKFYTQFAADPQNSVWSSDLDPTLLAFSKGNLGMFFGYQPDYFSIKQYNPNLSFQVVPVPQIPGRNITLASYWVEGGSVRSKHQKEVLTFLKFLAKKETAQKLFEVQSKFREVGDAYARVDLADSLVSNPNIYPFVQQAQNATSSYFVDGTNDNGLNQQLNTYLANIINSIKSSSEISDDVIGTFISSVLQTFSKYGITSN